MNNQPTTSTSKGIIIMIAAIFAGIVILCGGLGFLGYIADKNNPNKNTAQNQTNNAVNSIEKTESQTKTIAAKPSPSVETSSNITWDDYDRIFSIDSNSTDMQKESLWKDFEGKKVNWSGEVVEVSEGSFSGLQMSVKMNKKTLTQDLIIYLKSDQKSKAMSLTKGTKIKFSGNLKSYGGALLPGTIEDGEILK